MRNNNSHFFRLIAAPLLAKTFDSNQSWRCSYLVTFNEERPLCWELLYRCLDSIMFEGCRARVCKFVLMESLWFWPKTCGLCVLENWVWRLEPICSLLVCVIMFYRFILKTRADCIPRNVECRIILL